ncbi:BQ5605_C046g12274 [Microbotryum silenes-dioicae]|uniref:BQ5605_C046g12274 protein n=1 Tax=Microbotryum silenes-dioicae TaxID=796604 RepID=A0A2X0MPY5_9BASI|nr:BQ5605_C046g12274 [Microbotryum silenes-dioicae]
MRCLRGRFPAAWTLRRSRPLIGSAPSVCVNTPLLASMRKSLPNRGQGRCKDLFEALQLAISRLRLWVQDSPSVAVEAKTSWGLNGLHARVVGVKAADDPVTIQEEDSNLAAAVAIGKFITALCVM